ncbi:MAG: hypothetical protein P4L92_23195 [Rudaea sp.]|nr:hypothetical protein [Rudaea sp.]
MRTHTILTLTAFAVMTGCSMGGSRTDPNTFTYDCSGAGKGFGDCTQKADTQCGSRGYKVVSQTGDSAPAGDGTTQMKRTLVVSCK